MLKLFFLSLIVLNTSLSLCMDKNTEPIELHDDLRGSLEQMQQAFHDIMNSVGTFFDSAHHGVSSAHTYYKNYDHTLSFKETEKTIQIILKAPQVEDSSLIKASLSKDSLEIEIPQTDRITKVSIDGFSVIMQETQQAEQKNEIQGAISFHQSMSKRVESKNLPKQVSLQDAKVNYKEDGTVIISLQKILAPVKVSTPSRAIPIQKIQ